MNTAQSQRYFKIGQTAKILGLSAETLRRWERAGKISFPRTPGGKRLFSATDLEAIRKILNQPQKPTQLSTFPQTSAHKLITKRPTKIYTSTEPTDNPASPLKKQVPLGNLVNLFVYLVFFILLAGNLPNLPNIPHFKVLSSKDLNNIQSEIKGKAVLGVETFIIPALEEGGGLAQNILVRAGKPISQIGSFFKSLGSSSLVIPLLGKSELETDGDLKVKGKGTFAKDLEGLGNLKIKGTATVGRLKTGIVDPYLIENDGLVQSTLEIRTISSTLGPADIVFTPGGLEKLRIKENGNVVIGNLVISNSGISGISSLTSSSISTKSITTTSDATIGGNITLSGVINSNTFTSQKLVFAGSSPSIYAGTEKTAIALDAGTTGAVNIASSSTGDINLGGGSSSTGCTITNSNGNLNCSGNITASSDLDVRGGDITTNQTTFNLINTTATTLNIGGAATTISIGASTGTTTLSSSLSVSGASTFTGNLTVNGRPTFTKAPTSAHTGTWAIDSSTWNVSDAAVYINPGSATADSNLFGIATAGGVKFAIDAEGDIFGRNLVLSGNTTTGTTTVSGDLSVEGGTTLGDATTDTLTINPATVTFSGGNKTIDITGAATRTLTILNSTVSQIANLDLSDGSLLTGGTTRIDNTGAGSFTTLSASSTLTASNGLTLTTGALSLTGTSGSIALTGFGTTSITSTTTSGDIVAFTDTSLNTASANLTNFTFKNNNTGAGLAVNGVTITEQAAGTPSSGTNTSNLLNLSAAAGGTVNGINISSATGFTNFLKTPTAVLDSAGALSGVTTLTATTLAGTLSTAAQASVTSVGTLTSLAVTGNINSSTGSLQTNGVTRIDNSGNLTAGTGSFAGSISPSLDATYDLGTAVLRWRDAYFSGDVTAGDVVFKNNFRLTENGSRGIDLLNPKGEKIASFDEDGNFWVKGEIRQSLRSAN